jgi:hypothetical protein
MSSLVSNAHFRWLDPAPARPEHPGSGSFAHRSYSQISNCDPHSPLANLSIRVIVTLHFNQGIHSSLPPAFFSLLAPLHLFAYQFSPHVEVFTSSRPPTWAEKAEKSDHTPFCKWPLEGKKKLLGKCSPLAATRVIGSGCRSIKEKKEPPSCPLSHNLPLSAKGEIRYHCDVAISEAYISFWLLLTLDTIESLASLSLIHPTSSDFPSLTSPERHQVHTITSRICIGNVLLRTAGLAGAWPAVLMGATATSVSIRYETCIMHSHAIRQLTRDAGASSASQSREDGHAFASQFEGRCR